MNWQHFRAFLWLRWRIRVNQFKRAGVANAVVLAILAPFIVLLPIAMCGGLFVVGFLADEKLPSAVVMFIWDGLVAFFFFSWAIGLLTELQRSEVLSLDRFLHLPVSLKGVFLINYLSSLFSLTLLVFVPAMFGFGLGLVFSRGPAMLLLLPLIAAFILMVTAVTYQFQGWLASLMVNKRRRRTIIVMLTLGFVLICQLPNLVNVLHLQGKTQPDDFFNRQNLAQNQLEIEHVTKTITEDEYKKRRDRIQRETQEHLEKKQESEEQLWREVQEIGWYANLALPIGWLPLGAMEAANGKILPALAGTLGLALIGILSLWRSYKTTVRLYTGHYTAGKTARGSTAVSSRDGEAPAETPPRAVAPIVDLASPSSLLERKLPWISEQASVIALSAFRSLVRAPEGKMMLLSPIIMVVIFGSMFIANSIDPPEEARPFMIFAGVAMILIGMIQLMGNQFGFDRSGFRVFVLCAAPRRDILLGKNLAFAPVAFALSSVMVIVIEAVFPLRWDHFLAVFPQMVSVYLLFCLLVNCLSIIAPMPISAGSLKPANPKLVPILLQMACLMLMPLAILPTLVPLGLELMLQALDLTGGVPIWLILSPLECIAAIWLYRLVLTWQGAWLQSREQKILQAVTTKAE